jgi:Tol biopolymer transport system component
MINQRRFSFGAGLVGSVRRTERPHHRQTRIAQIVLALMLGFGLSFGAATQPITAQESGAAMLAVIGDDGNLSIYDAAGQNPRAITTDATPGLKLYQWPTWSTDGRLAFFGASGAISNPYRLGVFVVRDPATSLAYETAWQATDEVFTYAYWSTGDCGAGNCRDLALLFTTDGLPDLAVRMIRDDGKQFTDRIAGRAAPFYYSFSPDGKRMIWHRFGTQIELYDADTNKVTTTLADAPGSFASPMWSPVDERLLFGVQGERETTDLVVATGDERQTLVSGIENNVSFAWSADATKISYLPSGGKLTVIDAQTGAEVAQATQSNVFAHFWSPQGDRIAYLRLNRGTPGLDAQYRPNGHTASVSQQSLTLTWFVLDVATGQTTSLVDFYPTQAMIYYLNFFDQFSRSHRLWSPDGQFVVYGDSDPANNDRVMLIDTRVPGQPLVVAPGSLGVWSWR